MNKKKMIEKMKSLQKQFDELLSNPTRENLQTAERIAGYIDKFERQIESGVFAKSLSENQVKRLKRKYAKRNIDHNKNE